MSASSRLGSRGDRNRGKFRSVDIGPAHRGSQQKTSAGKRQHVLQNSNQAFRRMPPPVNLPSLKSENARLCVDIGNSPVETTGCTTDERNIDSGFAPSLLHSSYEQLGLLPPQSLNMSGGQGAHSHSRFPVGTTKSQGMFMDQKLRKFQEDFPKLASGVENAAAMPKKEEKNIDLTYGPGPSLRPQNVSIWREGGGRVLEQESPPATPSALKMLSPVATGDNSTVDGQTSAASHNSGNTANADAPTSHDSQSSCQPTDSRGPSSNESYQHGVEKPSVKSGPNGSVPFRVPMVPPCYGPMMMPPFGVQPGFAHAVRPGMVYPVMPRLPYMNPFNFGYPGFAYVDQSSTGAHRSSGDASCPSSVDEMSIDAFKRLSVSGSDIADNKYHKSAKVAYDDSSDGGLYTRQSSDSGVDYLPRHNDSASTDDVFGIGYKNPVKLSMKASANNTAVRSSSLSDDANTQHVSQSNDKMLHQMPQRSLSSPQSAETEDQSPGTDDTWSRRRKQQARLMSEAVERARRRREEEEKLLIEKQKAAALEKLKRLEEKTGKKTEKEPKEDECKRTESTGLKRQNSLSVGSDTSGSRQDGIFAADRSSDTVKSSDTDIQSPLTSPTIYPPLADGVQRQTMYPCPIPANYFHRLPSPKCFMSNASWLRMPFPQYPFEAYMYWPQQYLEQGAGNSSSRMRSKQDLDDEDNTTGQDNVVPHSERKLRANNVLEHADDDHEDFGDQGVASFAWSMYENRTARIDRSGRPDDKSSLTKTKNSMYSNWAQPAWMKEDGSSVAHENDNPTVDKHSDRPYGNDVAVDKNFPGRDNRFYGRNPTGNVDNGSDLAKYPYYYQSGWPFHYPFEGVNSEHYFSPSHDVGGQNQAKMKDKIQTVGVARDFGDDFVNTGAGNDTPMTDPEQKKTTQFKDSTAVRFGGKLAERRSTEDGSVLPAAGQNDAYRHWNSSTAADSGGGSRKADSVRNNSAFDGHHVFRRTGNELVRGDDHAANVASTSTRPVFGYSKDNGVRSRGDSFMRRSVTADHASEPPASKKVAFRQTRDAKSAYGCNETGGDWN